MGMEALEERWLLSSVVANVRQAWSDWYTPAVTPDDHYLAFTSQDPLQSQYPDATNEDVFVRDNLSGSIELISRTDGKAVGGSEASISADGRYVAFSSKSEDLIPGFLDRNNGPDVFVFDRQSGTLSRVSIPPPTEVRDIPGQFGKSGTTQGARNPSITADGTKVIFAADRLVGGFETSDDLYVRDIAAGQTTR